MNAQNYGWLSPTGRLVQENPMLIRMAMQYVQNPEEALRKLDFIQIIISNNTYYAVSNDTEATQPQLSWLSQKAITFVERPNSSNNMF